MTVTPHEDNGYFGPGSVTWKVWTYPTSVTVGFQRAVVIEELDPALIAAVDATDAVRKRARTRYDRTLRYFALIALGGTRAAMEASDVLVKIHAKAVGIDPLTGKRYDANDPQSQLWIHLTAWHSILFAYEHYGPGKLSAADETRYWQECAVAAELQTCDPADVPRTRDGVRAYFEYMRPKLAGSEAAQAMMDHLLHAEVMLPPVPFLFRPAAWIATRTLRAATIATMPRWMRKLGGLRQSRMTDTAVRIAMRVAFRVIDFSPRFKVRALHLLSPSTVSVAAPVLLGIPPREAVTLTPAEARQRYGILRPTEAYARLRARLDAKAATRPDIGPEAPESVATLGPVA